MSEGTRVLTPQGTVGTVLRIINRGTEAYVRIDSGACKLYSIIRLRRYSKEG